MVVDIEGFGQIDELINTEKEKLKEAVRAKAAAFQNDTNSWHDNAAYDDALEKENGAIMEINRLIDIKNTIEIISKHDDGSAVDIGDVVTIELDNEEIFDVILTGKFLANSKNGEITLNSPIGQSIYKKKVGDIVKFKTHDNRNSLLKIIELRKTNS